MVDRFYDDFYNNTFSFWDLKIFTIYYLVLSKIRFVQSYVVLVKLSGMYFQSSANISINCEENGHENRLFLVFSFSYFNKFKAQIRASQTPHITRDNKRRQSKFLYKLSC